MTSSTDDQGRATTYSYSPAGRMTGKSYFNGIETEYSYDTGGLVSSLEVKKSTGEIINSYQMSRDARANITSVTEDSANTTSYTYDASSRLTGENNPWTGSATYTYDTCGNRLTEQKQNSTLTYSYNSADELNSDSAGNVYTYDTRGNLTKAANGSYEKDFTWDGKGRMTSVTDTDNHSSTFTYDPLNRTHSSQEDGNTLYHIYDMGSDMEMATLDGAQSLKTLFVSGADGLISSTTNNTTSCYSFNPHDDVSLITDETGNTTQTLHYDAWGNKAEETDETNTYLGKRQRPEYKTLGLIKMGARFYNPQTGRFISRDPMKGHDEAPISRNPYVYAGDDPVNMRDLSGLDAWSDQIRKNARKAYSDAQKCFNDRQWWQGQNCEENGDRMMAAAARHDEKIGQATPTSNSQSAVSPKQCSNISQGLIVIASPDPDDVAIPPVRDYWKDIRNDEPIFGKIPFIGSKGLWLYYAINSFHWKDQVKIIIWNWEFDSFQNEYGNYFTKEEFDSIITGSTSFKWFVNQIGERMAELAVKIVY